MYLFDEAPPPKVAIAVIILGALVLLALSALGDKKEEDIQLRQYCDLVALGKADPDLGWPDFKGTFNQHCNPDGTVKKGKE